MRISFILSLILWQSSIQAQLIPFRVNELWGYSDTSGKIIIEPRYNLADFFDGPIAFVLQDTLYYGINPQGSKITFPVKRYGSFVNGLCPVQLPSGNCVYIDRTGKVRIDLALEAAENFSEGLAVVSVGKKLGIIDSLGRWIRQPDFDTSSQYYRSGFLLGLSNGKYFYIDRRGKNLELPDSVAPGALFSEGLAPVFVSKQRNSAGEPIPTTFLEFIDSSGRIVLSSFVNEGIDYSEYITLEKEFRDGKAIIKARNEIGWDYFFIDKKKRFSPLYSAARQLGDSLFLGAIGYYMSDVRIVDSNYYVMGQFQQKPTQVGEFGDGLLAFRDKDGNWGYIDSNCRMVIQNKYSMAYTFRKGYAYVIRNGRLGVINQKGKEYFYDRP